MSNKYTPGDVARFSSADRKLYKTKNETRKYNLPKDTKTEQISKFSTFQEAYEHNLKLFDKRKKKNKNKSSEIEELEIEYLLDTIPFIKEYGNDLQIDDTTAAKNDNDLINVKYTNSNKNTFNKYLYHVEKVKNSETFDAVASECKTSTDDLAICSCGGVLIFDPKENINVCVKCGTTQVYVESHTVREITEGMAYKRINHLTECLNALQGKEGTKVPNEVVEKVRAEFRKNRIYSTAEIKPSKVKLYLKKLGYSAYYENTHTIANMISGQKMLVLTVELEKKFKDMFNAIQEPFYRHKPPKRKNFLSYNYVLYKFSELLGEDDLLIHFPLLKCQKNLHSQDTVWSKICADLSWEYIATV